MNAKTMTEERLLNALHAAADEFFYLSRYRRYGRQHDKFAGRTPRTFLDKEDWDITEGIARAAFQAARRAIIRSGRGK